MTNLQCIPVYFQPYYQKLGFRKGHCPESEKYYEEALTLPLYATMTDDDESRVISAMQEVCF